MKESHGLSRYTVIVDNQKVIKIAKNATGREENRLSYKIWDKCKDEKVFAPILEISNEENVTTQNVEQIILSSEKARSLFLGFVDALDEAGYNDATPADIHHFTNPSNFAYNGSHIIMVDYGSKSLLKLVESKQFMRFFKNKLLEICTNLLKEGEIETHPYTL